MLAILGGILVARTSDRREKRKLYLEKLEEIPKTATEVRGWAETHIQVATVALIQIDIEALKPRAPTERLQVLVAMYEPALSGAVVRLVELVDEQRNAEYEY